MEIKEAIKQYAYPLHLINGVNSLLYLVKSTESGIRTLR